MIQPLRRRASARSSSIFGPASASGPATSSSSGVPRYAPQKISTPSGSTARNEQSASSITTRSSMPSGQPSFASRRPVVIWTAPPTRLSAIRWRAVSAWTLLMPGMTSYSNAIVPAARMRSMTSIVLSYSDGSPHTSRPPTASSESSSRSAPPHTSARRARQSSTAPA